MSNQMVLSAASKKYMRAINSTDFFCPICGIGERGNCQAPHAELSKPGSQSRHVFLISMIGIVAIIVFVFTLGNR